MRFFGTTESSSDPQEGGDYIFSPNGWEDDVKTRVSREPFLRRIAASPIDQVLSHFQSNIHGLSNDESNSRRRFVGANILSVKQPLPWWKMLLLSIPNPFTILLGLLAVICVATPPPEWSNFVILILMIIISVTVKFWQEYRSSMASIKLQGNISTTIRVRRPELGEKYGETFVEHEVDFSCIVPGDVIALDPGDSVPADCLLLDANRLQISQSNLTGESEPQRKTPISVTTEPTDAIFDLGNLAFMGASVISGSGTGLVVATGDRTFVASITEQLNKKRPVSAFERGILYVSYLMICFMLVMVTVVLVVRGKLSGDWRQAAIFSLSVAVGIVPEMLPAMVNTNLARGAFVLAKQGAIVKSVAAVQNFGSMTVLCSDKTGTLTKDEIALHRAMDCQGRESDGVLGLASTNAAFQSGKKNNIDAAILSKANDVNASQTALIGDVVAEIPFHFEKRRSSIVVRVSEQQYMLICKGAFEEVASLCSRVRLGEEIELDPLCRQEMDKRAHKYSSGGYRVLAVASKLLTKFENSDDGLEDVDSEMVLESMLTFLDPPRDDAAGSIQSLQELGVEIKVLTGDSLQTASQVCASLNISSCNVEEGLRCITGPELAQLSTEEFHTVVQQASIFAKLTPVQKGQVIMSLKEYRGQTVSMLGDGINDCIALRFADVGISVNNAVNVAKDCADVILTEKSLSIIVAGVRTGRLTHGNTMKYIKMVASSNFGNVLSVLIASVWLPYQPMTSLQILVQNLLYDVSQVALPWDRVDEDYLSRPQAWDTLDLLRFILFLGPLSYTIDMCTFSLGWYCYGIQSPDDPRVQLFNTHWFLEGLLTQTVVVHVLRTAKIPILQSRPSPSLVGTTLFIMGVGLAIPYIPPIARVLSMVKPATSFIGFLMAELVIYCLEVQAIKLLYTSLFKRWL